jgi:hypothetical protein
VVFSSLSYAIPVAYWKPLAPPKNSNFAGFFTAAFTAIPFIGANYRWEIYILSGIRPDSRAHSKVNKIIIAFQSIFYLAIICRKDFPSGKQSALTFFSHEIILAVDRGE